MTSNPLQTRADVECCLLELLAPLENCAHLGGYHLGDSAAAYSPAIAAFEGLSRTLWAVAPLLAGKTLPAAENIYPGLKTLLELIKEGLNPLSPAYWGELTSRDQRLVELSAIGFSLLIARNVFWEELDKETRARLASWLSTVQNLEYPPGNWLYFRMMVLFALRSLGLPVDEAKAEADMAFLDNCYKGGGWFEDGPDGTYDYYNPWGFHFYGLLYTVFARERDPHRAAFYLDAAREFLPRYAAWFHADGSHIPYGRSLTYRFASVGVFSACAFAGEEVLPWGILKGLVLRSLRYWFSRPILDKGGVLSIGYGYPNLLMAESYNSPGSPYWGLKAFLVLALPETHPFWRAKEEAPPNGDLSFTEKTQGFMVSHTKEDAVLLCSGQNPAHDSGQAAAKYNKFSYSARFGFSVSLSPYQLELCGADSCLLLSELEKNVLWRERRAVEDKDSGDNWVCSTWKPWSDVIVKTWLVNLGDAHIRLHRIQSGRALLCAEGGFSITRRNGDKLLPPETVAKGLPSKKDDGSVNAFPDASAVFPWGASRIIALEKDSRRSGRLIEAQPNLNIVHTHGIIPILECRIEKGETMLITAVRAGDSDATLTWKPDVDMDFLSTFR